MSTQIHKIGAFFPRGLVSVVGMGIVIFSMLMAGCKHNDSGDSTANRSDSPEAIAKRIEPVGKVNIIHSSEKTSKTTAAPAKEETTQTTAAPENSKKGEPQTTSAPDAKTSSQATDTEQTSSMASGKESHEPSANSDQK